MINFMNLSKHFCIFEFKYTIQYLPVGIDLKHLNYLQ